MKLLAARGIRRYNLANMSALRRGWLGAVLFCLPIGAQVRVTAPTLPAGLLGNSYGTVETTTGALQLTIPRYTATGGTAPYTFRVSSGALPPGMSLGTGGGLLGAPTATGSFSFEVRATDAGQQSGTVQSAITVGNRPRSAVSGRVGTPFRLERKCGIDAAAQATFSYAINGNPPPGIRFDASASVFEGTPTAEGAYTVVWGCASQAQGTAFSVEYVFTIGGEARISLNPGRVARPYAFTPLRLAAGAPPYVFAVTSGALPPGLTLSNAALGTITGTPSSAGSFTWTFTRTDAAQRTLTATYDLSIREATGFQPSVSAWNVSRRAGDPPFSLDVFVEGTPQAQAYAVTVESSGGAWLQANPASGQISGRFRMTVETAGLAPGEYTGKVRLSRPEGAGGPDPVEIPVNLEVLPGSPARLRVSGNSNALKPGELRSYTVTNVGGDTARGLRVRSSPAWLDSSLGVTTLAPGQSTSLNLNPKPDGQAPGAYSGSASLSGENVPSGSVAATIRIPASPVCYFEPASVRIPVQPSNTTLSYWSNIKFENAELAEGPLSWELKQETIFGAANLDLPNWMLITPTSGEGDTPLQMTVLIGNLPDELKIGEHVFGFVLSSRGCRNNLWVSVHIVGAEAPIVDPSGASFPAGVTSEGVESPQQLVLNLVPVTAEPVGYRIRFYDDLFTNQSASFFRFDPPEGEVRGENVPVRVTSEATRVANHGGPHKVTLHFRFNKLGQELYGSRWVPVYHPIFSARPGSLPPLPFGGAAKSAGPRSAEECTATSVFVAPLMAEPVEAIVGAPTEVKVLAFDNCGRPMTEGSMEAEPSSGEGVLALRHEKDGVWTGTWAPKREAESLSLAVKAVFREASGQEQIGASVRDPSVLPVANSVRNAASELGRGTVAPGTLLVVRGRRLASERAVVEAGAAPEPVLGGVRVVYGSAVLPLLRAEEEFVVALVPSGAELDGEAQLTVMTQAGPAAPILLTAVPTSPGIYTVDGSGSGQGSVTWTGAEGTPVLADKNAPASAGTELTVSATGLGRVNEETGLTREPVTVNVGGVEVTDAAAAPREGRPGEYAIRFKLPEGVTAGEAVPLFVTAGGTSSQTVTIAVK